MSGECCSRLAAAEPQSVSPDGAPDPPVPGRTLTIDEDLKALFSLQTEGSTISPSLMPDAALSLLTMTPLSLSKDFLWDAFTLWSSQQPLREVGLSIV